MEIAYRYSLVNFLFLLIFTTMISTVATKAITSPAPSVIELNNGKFMPSIGLGTFLAKENECENAVKEAIDAGYRHIDTAYYYGNEHEVGNAINFKISEGIIKREDVFIVTKLWNTFHAPHLVELAFRKSLENLNLTYIDLYLMHMPMGYKYNENDITNVQEKLYPLDADGNIEPSDIDYVDTWKAMENIQKQGLAHSIGISNFNSEQIKRLITESEILPVTNQVECSPNLNQKKLIEFCKQYGIIVTAYSPLGRPHYAMNATDGPQPVLNNTDVKRIAEKYQKTPAQIILRYLIQLGTVPIPKSSNPMRIKENINIFDFQLNDDEMEIMLSLNRNERMVPFKLSLKHKYYPFHIEF